MGALSSYGTRLVSSLEFCRALYSSTPSVLIVSLGDTQKKKWSAAGGGILISLLLVVMSVVGCLVFCHRCWLDDFYIFRKFVSIFFLLINDRDFLSCTHTAAVVSNRH